MSSELREAAPVAKLLGENCETTVGWVYVWNTGELRVLWLRPRERACFITPSLDQDLVVKAAGVTDADLLDFLANLSSA